MLFGILLFIGRRQQVVLGIVVDHGFRQHLIFGIAFRILQMFIHKCRNLVHVKINARNLFRPDIA